MNLGLKHLVGNAERAQTLATMVHKRYFSMVSLTSVREWHFIIFQTIPWHHFLMPDLLVWLSGKNSYVCMVVNIQFILAIHCMV